MRQLARRNIRDYMMYIALAVIMLFFSLQTHGGFLSARNITTLINQSGYVAVLAIGMTVILIIRHIDLSVGYVAGFSGAIAAILMTQFLRATPVTHSASPKSMTIPAVILMAAAIGPKRP